MKTNSKRLIKFLKVGLDVAWYGNFLLAALALAFLIYEFSSEEYTRMGLQVRIPTQKLNEITSSTNLVKDISLATREGELTLLMKNTFWHSAVALFFFGLIEFFVFIIIFELRRLFSRLSKGHVFTYDNVVVLRRLAMIIALIWPLGFLIQLVQRVVIQFSVPRSYRLSVTESAFDYKILLVAAILYIIAEVFNHGLELKKENEEFV